MKQFFKWLTAFMMTTSLQAHEESLSQEAIIREVLQEANEQVFSQRSIEVKLLKDCSLFIPTLVEWLYDDWHSYDGTLTKERLFQGLTDQLAYDGMPFTLVALIDALPVGMVSLKKDGPVELSDLPGPWSGSFHVIPQVRYKRIGTELAKVILTIAKRLGHNQVNFYTSNPRNVERYLKRGAIVIDTRPFRGHTITTMKMDL